jgi:uncharacterized protein
MPAMSQQNVELMRGVYAEMARGNFWALAPLLDEDVEWEWDPRFASLVGGPQTYRGPDGVERATKEVLAGWKWFTIEAEDFIEADGTIVVLTHQRARARHGDAEIDQPAADLWTLRDGKVVAFRGFYDRGEALRAAGLSQG